MCLLRYCTYLFIPFFFSRVCLSFITHLVGKNSLTLAQSRGRNFDELHTQSNYIVVSIWDWDSMLGVIQRHWLNDLRAD